jgi:hypothetical protein
MITMAGLFLGTQLPQDGHDYTYSIPYNQEILDTLKEKKRNASPRLDGFNVWSSISELALWIGQDMLQLVRNSFQIGIISAHINDTHIALIEKKRVPLAFAKFIAPPTYVHSYIST